MNYDDFFTPIDAPTTAQQKDDPYKQLMGNIETQLALYRGEKRLNRKQDPIQPTWEELKDGQTIRFQLKYANAPCEFPNGKKFQEVPKDKFEKALTFLKERVEAGDFDAEIERIRTDRKWDNTAARTGVE